MCVYLYEIYVCCMYIYVLYVAHVEKPGVATQVLVLTNDMWSVDMYWTEWVLQKVKQNKKLRCSKLVSTTKYGIPTTYWVAAGTSNHQKQSESVPLKILNFIYFIYDYFRHTFWNGSNACLTRILHTYMTLHSREFEREYQTWAVLFALQVSVSSGILIMWHT